MDERAVNIDLLQAIDKLINR